MKPEPWYAPGAKEWLEERIEPGWEAFEWGSGGSTLWLAGLCDYVVSIEHDEGWLRKTQDALPSMKNVVIMLVPPEISEMGDDPSDPAHYKSSCVDGVNFLDYARTVDGFEPDVVLVDGRVRASCIAHAVARKPKILVLDNADRSWYLEKTLPLLEGWRRTDFRGGWLTSAWEAP